MVARDAVADSASLTLIALVLLVLPVELSDAEAATADADASVAVEAFESVVETETDSLDVAVADRPALVAEDGEHVVVADRLADAATA